MNRQFSSFCYYSLRKWNWKLKTNNWDTVLRLTIYSSSRDIKTSTYFRWVFKFSCRNSILPRVIQKKAKKTLGLKESLRIRTGIPILVFILKGFFYFPTISAFFLSPILNTFICVNSICGGVILLHIYDRHLVKV